MKKVTIWLVFVLFASIIFGQNTNIAGTFSALKSGYLDKAKKYIDAAAQNEQTKGLAKTWFFRGNVYLSIAKSDPKSKYKILDTNAIQVAYDSYQKALKIDPNVGHDELNPSSPMLGISYCGEDFYNQGVESFIKKNFTVALGKFELAKKVYGITGQKDTLSTYGAVLCAMQLRDTVKIKTYSEDLVKSNFKQSQIYSELTNIYKAKNDTLKWFMLVKKARSLMPNDLNIMILEVNVDLYKHKIIDAEELSKIASSNGASNPILFLALGVNWDEYGYIEQTEGYYNKAIEVKSDYFDAYYNLGALYVNTAAKFMKEANALPISETAKYDELKGKADKFLEKALPALETAEKLSPSDYNTLITLKQIYARKGDTERLKVIDDKILKLGNSK